MKLNEKKKEINIKNILLEEKVPYKLNIISRGEIQAGNFNGICLKNPELEFPFYIDSLENCADNLGYSFYLN